MLRRMLELLLPRFTWGEVVLRCMLLLLELLRLTWGVASLRLIELELLARLTVGAAELLLRETAADWLLLAVLPPCERLRPWAIASDALKIRHPMRAMLIMMFLTEVFIIVKIYIVQQIIFLCLLDCNSCAQFKAIIHGKAR